MTSTLHSGLAVEFLRLKSKSLLWKIRLSKCNSRGYTIAGLLGVDFFEVFNFLVRCLRHY